MIVVLLCAVANGWSKTPKVKANGNWYGRGSQPVAGATIVFAGWVMVWQGLAGK
jgi:hypothetical protein